MSGLAGRRAVMTVAFLAAVALSVFFVFRAVGHRPRFAGGESMEIRPWMSVPYIAHTYRVPPEILFAAIDLPAAPLDERPLARIARDQGRPVDELIARIERAVRADPSAPAPPAAPQPAQPGGAP